MDDMNFIFKRKNYSYYLKELDNGLNRWVRRKTYNFEQMHLLYLKNHLTSNDVVFAFEIDTGENYMEPGKLIELPAYESNYEIPEVFYNYIPQSHEEINIILKRKSEEDSRFFGVKRDYTYKY